MRLLILAIVGSFLSVSSEVTANKNNEKECKNLEYGKPIQCSSPNDCPNGTTCERVGGTHNRPFKRCLSADQKNFWDNNCKKG